MLSEMCKENLFTRVLTDFVFCLLEYLNIGFHNIREVLSSD